MHPPAKFYRCGFKIVSLQPPKSQKLVMQRVAPGGKKTIFGPLSKNDTSMAVLRAGLPVMSI